MSWHLSKNNSVFTVIPILFPIIATVIGRDSVIFPSAGERARLQVKSDGWLKIRTTSKALTMFFACRSGVGIILNGGRI